MEVDVVTEIEIARPRAEVASFAMDPDNVSNGYRNIEQVEWKTPKPLQVGSKLAFIARFLGRTIAYTYEVIEMTPGERFVMATAEGPFAMETTYSWTATVGEGTRMMLRNRGRPSYLALLRGINVGGKNKVEMARLKVVFEDAGMTSVRTYINSGNVIFSTAIRGRARVAELVEEAIAKGLGLKIDVIVRDLKSMRVVVGALPSHWTNDNTMKCDVMFLWDDVDRASVLKQLRFKPELEDVRYVPGAIIWRVDRKDVTRSGMMKLVGMPLYKRMTIRNCNTARKLLELMEA